MKEYKSKYFKLTHFEFTEEQIDEVIKDLDTWKKNFKSKKKRQHTQEKIDELIYQAGLRREKLLEKKKVKE